MPNEDSIAQIWGNTADNPTFRWASALSENQRLLRGWETVIKRAESNGELTKEND